MGLPGHQSGCTKHATRLIWALQFQDLFVKMLRVHNLRSNGQGLAAEDVAHKINKLMYPLTETNHSLHMNQLTN